LTQTIKKLIHKKLAGGWYYLVRGMLYRKKENIRRENAKILASMYLSASKKPRERLQSDIVHIKQWAKKVHKGVFNDMEDSEVHKFAKGVKLYTANEDELLFLQGTEGKDYWIVVQGIVQIYSEHDRHRISVKLELQKEYGASNLMGRFSQDSKFFGTVVATLNRGKSFGEVALFSDNSIRTGTAVACVKKLSGLRTTFQKPNPTILLKVERDIYMNCFSSHHKSAWVAQRKIRLLRSLVYFKQCTFDRIVDASYLFHQVVQERGTVLLEERGLCATSRAAESGCTFGEAEEHSSELANMNFYVIMEGSLKTIRRRTTGKSNQDQKKKKRIKKTRNTTFLGNEEKKKKLALEAKYKGGTSKSSSNTGGGSQNTKNSKSDMGTLEGSDNANDADFSDGDTTGTSKNNTTPASSSSNTSSSSLSSSSSSSSSTSSLSSTRSSSILKHYELASRQSYCELSSTEGPTVYGVSNLLRHADANRYTFLQPNNNDENESMFNTTSVVCTSRVEMYVLNPNAMSTLLDYLRGTSAVEMLHQLYTHRKTHSNIQASRVARLFSVPPPLKPKSEIEKQEEQKEQVRIKKRSRALSVHRRKRVQSAQRRGEIKEQNLHLNSIGQGQRPGTAPSRGRSRNFGRSSRPSTAPIQRPPNNAGPCNFMENSFCLPPRPTSSTSSLRSSLRQRQDLTSSLSSISSSISSLPGSFTTSPSHRHSNQRSSSRPSTAPMTRKGVDKLLNSTAPPHFGATVFRRKVAMLPSKQDRFAKVDLVSHHMSDAYAQAANRKKQPHMHVSLDTDARSLRAMAGTTHGSVALWLKKRQDGKEKMLKKIEKSNRRVRRQPFYVTRDRSKKRERKSVMVKRETSDTLRSRALDNALDRELARRLVAQRRVLGLKDT